MPVIVRVVAGVSYDGFTYMPGGVTRGGRGAEKLLRYVELYGMKKILSHFFVCCRRYNLPP